MDKLSYEETAPQINPVDEIIANLNVELEELGIDKRFINDKSPAPAGVFSSTWYSVWDLNDHCKDKLIWELMTHVAIGMCRSDIDIDEQREQERTWFRKASASKNVADPSYLIEELLAKITELGGEFKLQESGYFWGWLATEDYLTPGGWGYGKAVIGE